MSGAANGTSILEHGNFNGQQATDIVIIKPAKSTLIQCT